MHHYDQHLTDGELLEAIDRELPLRRQASVEAHLAQCVVCQARRTQIARLVGSVTTFYQRSVTSSAGGAGHARTRLRSKLKEIADDPGGFSRVRLFSGLVPAPEWAAIGAAVAAAVLLIRLVGPSPPRDPRSLVAPVERDALPVAALTPGVSLNLGLGELCAGGTREPRQASAAVRQQVLRDYGMEGVPYDEYELDYLITPELGGAPDARNLWPQRYTSRVWNARIKDQLERLLPQLVCDRQVELETAQRDIALDWIAAYKKYFKTETPLQTQASLVRDEDPDSRELADAGYPALQSASAPAPRLISFSPAR